METVYLNNQPCRTCGNLPRVGDKMPDFTLVDGEFNEVRSDAFSGKKILLNIYPSIDTGVCAASARRFNLEAATLADTQTICVSMDLPFAIKRFCAAEGIHNIITASAFRSPEFAQKFGVRLIDGPLAGLFARAVIIADQSRRIIYTELVREITTEPNYPSALNALRG